MVSIVFVCVVVGHVVANIGCCRIVDVSVVLTHTNHTHVVCVLQYCVLFNNACTAHVLTRNSML